MVRMQKLVPIAIGALVAVGGVVLLTGGDDAPETRSDRVVAPLVAYAAADPVDVGTTPAALAVSPGLVWIVDGAARTLVRLDARTRKALADPEPVAGGPFAVAVGAGAAWVASGDGTIRAFDLRTGRADGRMARVRGANGLAVAPDGVWVTSRMAGTVTRIDPRTMQLDRPIRVGQGPADVAIGGGSIWVANAAGGSVSRVDAKTGTAAPPISVGASQVLGLALDDDSVWVVRAAGEFAEKVELVRIDAESGKTDDTATAVSGTVGLDVAAAGDSVWVTDAGDRRSLAAQRRGTVTRVDARTGRRIGQPITVGRGPDAVAVGAEAVWVANGTDGTVTPLEPAG